MALIDNEQRALWAALHKRLTSLRRRWRRLGRPLGELSAPQQLSRLEADVEALLPELARLRRLTDRFYRRLDQRGRDALDRAWSMGRRRR